MAAGRCCRRCSACSWPRSIRPRPWWPRSTRWAMSAARRRWCARRPRTRRRPPMPGPIRWPTADGLDRLYRPQALDVPVMMSRDGPIAAIDPRDAAVPIGGATAGAASAMAGRRQRRSGGAGGRADAPAVELLAVRPSWVRVSAADGTVLFEKILDAGERYAVPQMEAAGRAARRQFRVGLFRGERPDLRPGRARGAGGQERGAVARGADGEPMRWPI